VAEVSFDAAGAIAAGKRVFYATHVGLFRLREHGLELALAFPGVDVARDVVSFAPARERLPAARPIPRVPRALLTAEGRALGRALRAFRLPA
jgi:acyl CoA:acetate/3-ketoacid CoA transferase